MPLDLVMTAETDVTVEAVLTVSATEGCVAIPDIIGIAVSGPLLSQSAHTLDFGNVKAGTTSAPKTASFLFQEGASSSASSVLGQPSVEGPFEVTSSSKAGGSLVPCEANQIAVSFVAPAESGVATGLVALTVENRVGDQAGEGILVIYLSGNSVETR